jgi:hypothetical protein
MKHIKDVKTMGKTYYKTSMKQLSGNIKMEERIGFRYLEEHKFLGVQVDRETTLIALNNSWHNLKKLK